MNSFFPKYISNKAMSLYAVLLLLIPLLFGYAMEWFAWVWGIASVFGFFYYANSLSKSWMKYDNRTFAKRLLTAAILIRVIYVIISYLFYDNFSATPPFELGERGDSWNYDHKASACAENIRRGEDWSYIALYLGSDIADMGYVFYLTFIYLLTGDSIFFARIINSLLSAYVVLASYKIASRHFGEANGRIAGIICLLMPNLIFYCGIHLKEVVMVFLVVYFLNSADAIIVERGKWTKWIPMVLSGMALFAFRTVLGAVAFLAFFATLLFSSGKTLSWGKRIAIGLAMVGMLGIALGPKLKKEVTHAWEMSQGNAQNNNMEWRSKRKHGNNFAKYAGAAVFAPLIFTIPFPTMVATPIQENQRLIHGGNFVKNILSFFTIFAVFYMLFTGEWKKHVLILSFTIGYLIVLALSTFAQSERFHQPALPGEIILASFGVCCVQSKRHKRLFNYWIVLMFMADMAWQWFKLRGRGM